MKHVLCAGIAVVDQIFRVASFPRPDVKTQASSFGIVNGGNAANAAVAIAHLGARASFAGPLGGPGHVEYVVEDLERHPDLLAEPAGKVHQMVGGDTSANRDGHGGSLSGSSADTADI